MNDELIQRAKKDIIAIGVLLWEKELVSGLNGNISVRLDSEHFLITATKSCLGLLHEKDILLMNMKGEVLDDGQVSVERAMHLGIYQAFPDIRAVLHTHTPFANAYFLNRDVLYPQVFETKFYLGEVKAVDQESPSVTDVQPVIGALKQNNLIALKRHGVVAMGKNLFDCFLLIQSLEESVKVDAISRLYNTPASQRLNASGEGLRNEGTATPSQKYKLFSQEQINEIVRLVNEDQQLKELGMKTQMTMDLAVLWNETGKVYSFHFENGRITRVGNDGNVEFVISAPEAIWRAVFNRQIDPFVATTQKKMNLKGDFARISRWYAPCSRIFELWRQVPVD